jgi:hypothetical protein
MTNTIEKLISNNDEYYNQKLYDFRIIQNGIVFSYTENYLYMFNIVAHNLFKSYTISDVYIENISDDIFIDLIQNYAENKYITLKIIKDVLIHHKCEADIIESREKEWNFMSFIKWIVLV